MTLRMLWLRTADPQRVGADFFTQRVGVGERAPRRPRHLTALHHSSDWHEPTALLRCSRSRIDPRNGRSGYTKPRRTRSAWLSDRESLAGQAPHARGALSHSGSIRAGRHRAERGALERACDRAFVAVKHEQIREPQQARDPASKLHGLTTGRA